MKRDVLTEAAAVNTAARAIGALTLEGMTWERWSLLTDQERQRLRDNSRLTPQLKGYEDHRVEVIDNDGNRRRFHVGKSSGWRPVHLELHNCTTSGGIPADRSYQSVIGIASGDQLRRRNRGKR